MTTTTNTTVPTVGTTDPQSIHTRPSARIPLTRIVAVELRKSVDTRAGFWLLASVGIVSLLATGAVILWASASDLTQNTFTLAISVPMSVILPIIAVLSVTAEWSQRSGLTTFTLVPHRSRVVAAKAIGAVLVGVVATLVAFAVGAVGNLLGTAATDTAPVWDQSIADLGRVTLSNVLLMLVGFTFGVLIRNSPGAIVAYFVYAFVAPPLLAALAYHQSWFHDAQPWVDPNHAQNALLHGAFTGEQWTQLAVTTTIWLLLPLAAGIRAVLRTEVK
jgi:hypothetical protein